ncbi:MAG: hypothetical protein RSE00_01965 [Clostridia bacterium]
MKRIKGLIALGMVFTLLITAWATVRGVKASQFERNCGEYIRRATVAADIQTAKVELAKALNYAEKEKLTKGTVKLFRQDPRNDLGFWYNTLSSSYQELDKVSNGSWMEQSASLMKMRGSLQEMVIPTGITIYPYNMFYFVWVMVALFGATICYLLAYAYLKGKHK